MRIPITFVSTTLPIGLFSLSVVTSGLWYACTVKVDAPVPQPKITIGCVLIELPGGNELRQCDGGEG